MSITLSHFYRESSKVMLAISSQWFSNAFLFCRSRIFHSKASMKRTSRLRCSRRWALNIAHYLLFTKQKWILYFLLLYLCWHSGKSGRQAQKTCLILGSRIFHSIVMCWREWAEVRLTTLLLSTRIKFGKKRWHHFFIPSYGNTMVTAIINRMTWQS